MSELTLFLSGGIVVAHWAVGMFFYRFWKRSHDRLFLMFALAFWVFMVERVLLLTLTPSNEVQPLIYLARVCGFLLILWGIWDRNRRRE